VVDQREEGIEEPFHIDQHDRLRMQVKLRVSDRLRHLVERAQPARQHGKAVARREHLLFAVEHRIGGDDLRGNLQRRLEVAQESGNHPQHVRAALRGRERDHAHQPDAAAAEHEIAALGGDESAHALGGGAIDGVLAE